MTCISDNYKNSFIILFSYLTLTRLEDIAFLISLINLRSHGVPLKLLIISKGTITDIQLTESESNYTQYKSK